MVWGGQLTRRWEVAAVYEPPEARARQASDLADLHEAQDALSAVGIFDTNSL